jgi:hypothetical protein
MLKAQLVLLSVACVVVLARAQQTVRGCHCKDKCHADVGDGFKCDFCRTFGNCGSGSPLGHWDYCTYPEDQSFEAKTWAEQTDALWKEITADTTPGSYPSAADIFTESVVTSFDDMTDEFPAGRVKAIHSQGVICQFKFEVSAASTYTGLLGPGVQHGFMRMGSAKVFGTSPKDTPTAGMGFKFSRTGVHSGDFVAMYGTSAGLSFNFFQRNISNHIPVSPELPLKLVAKKFEQASQCPTQVGLSDLAKYSQDGTKHERPKFPFKLFFVPSQEAQQPAGSMSMPEMLKGLSEIPVGTPVLHVYACGKAGKDEHEPSSSLERSCGEPLFLGDMVTTSKCTTSSYGDKEFFIRHTRIEEDWQLEPSYLHQYDAATPCGQPGRELSPTWSSKCGSAEAMLDGDASIVV